jgi:cob(I)alamin adenosyltransferase
MPSSEQEESGLVVVLTGDGKGKTTGALGMALRACGHGIRVAFLQFIKSSRMYGEGVSVKGIPGLEFEVLGAGYVGIEGDTKPRAEHAKAAMAALSVARDRAFSGRYGMIVLDEINVALSLGLIPVSEVISFIDDRPRGLHLVLTGRGAPEEVIEKADLVTDMKAVKHPFFKGAPARQGIEY